MLPVLGATMASLQPPEPPRSAAPAPQPAQVVSARPQAFRDVLSPPRQMPESARITAEPMPPAAIAGPATPGGALQGGVVRLQAILAVDGTIAERSVIGGHPLLVKAAVDAVKQWRYKPTVDTQIEVNFTLGR